MALVILAGVFGAMLGLGWFQKVLDGHTEDGALIQAVSVVAVVTYILW